MKILNFGSLNIDYVYAVDHFIRPGETEAATSRDCIAGGKGLNQSIALARAGAEVFHAGSIGKTDGLFLKNFLKKNKVDISFVRETDYATGHTIIQVDKTGNNCILLYGGANIHNSPEFIDMVLKDFTADDFIVLQNEINNVPYIIEEAHKKGMKIFFNPSPITDTVEKINLSYIDCFLLNEIEAGDICRTDETAADPLLDSLQKKFPGAEIVLTLGKKGVIYAKGSSRYSHGIYDTPVVDTTAAGDTFTGYYIACSSKGYSIEDSLRLASVASSLSVSQKGAAPSIPVLAEVQTAKLKPVS
jgi:ribokinase